MILNIPAPLALTDHEKKTILSFLDEKEHTDLIAQWLQDWGISPFRAKLVAKLLIPALQRLLTATAGRAAERLHELLRKHWDFYDDLALRIGKWLFLMIEDRRTPNKLMGPYIDQPPSGVGAEDWKKINEQTKQWLVQVEKLDLIALALDDLKVQVSLRIDRPQQLARTPLSRLLRPYNAFIDLIGREPEVNSLAAFCDHPAAFRWKVLTGEGGVGKTRLALELAKTREEAGWSAGFLSAESLAHWVRHEGFPRWSPLAETLVVIDYAAAKAEDLKPLIERCGQWAEDNEESTRLRLLLLERQADPDNGWFHDLQSSAEGALRDQIRDSLEPVQEIRAPGRDDSDAVIEAILQATFRSWARLPGDPPPTLSKLDDQELRDLRRGTQGRPLFLQMAALRACAENNTSKLTQWGQEDLLQDAVGRERDYVKRHCDSNSTRVVLTERGIALLTFTGPLAKGTSAWLKLLQADARACGYPYAQPAEISDAISGLLSDTDAAGTPVLVPLTPDLLAEAFAVTVLGRRPDLAAGAMQAVLDCCGAQAWNNLLRALVDLYGLGALGVIESWLIDLAQRQPVGALALLEALIPERSVALARIAVVVGERQLQGLPTTSEAEAEQARIFNNLGNCYSELGRREEALGVTERAVAIRERLAKRNPDAFEPDLAGSLNNLGVRYSELGRREEALGVTERAVAIRERLAQRNPDAFEPDLAMSLNNLGNRYSELGRREEGLGATKRAAGGSQ